MLQLLGWWGVITSLFAVMMPVYFARKTVGYSARLHTLSELGAIDSPNQKAVSWCYFFPLSIAVLLFVMIGQSSIGWLSQSQWIWGMLGMVAVGYFVAALFPCDVGSPIGGSVRNQIHNVSGLLEYIGAGSGLILMGVYSDEHVSSPYLNLYLILSGSVILLSLSMLLFPAFNRVKGLVQRLAEASFFIWMLTVSLILLLSNS